MPRFTWEGRLPAASRSYSAAFWACTQVMAMTPTMSSAVQPRERSFTGAAMPYVMGPYASAFASRCTSL